MSDLKTLYQEVIFDHNKNPRNCGILPTANRRAEGFNPLCGDRITVHLELHDGIIQDVRFEAQSCAIATASASLMTEAVKGKSVDEADAVHQAMEHLLKDPGTAPSELGPLASLSGVSAFPTRIKCATLPWQALRAAMHDAGGDASTE